MSRSGYVEGMEYNWARIMWRGAVASSIRGKRGQAFLRELIEALDAMPEKRLIANALVKGGEVCALGSVGAKRGVEMDALDPEDFDTLAGVFGVAAPLVQELEWMNDDAAWNATPEKRWQIIRDWAASNLRVPQPRQATGEVG